MAEFHLKKGYDIPLVGETEDKVINGALPTSVAIKPTAFHGFQPKLRVAVGDSVKCGTPLVFYKDDERRVLTAPTSGVVKDIQRGARRALDAVIIEPDGKQESEPFTQYSATELTALSREDLMSQLLDSGLLALFRQRPFAHVATPDVVPRDIFVSTFDTAPLAPNLSEMVRDNEHYFQAGLDIASRLTTGKVHLSISGTEPNQSTAFSHAQNALIHRFSGPHPAGSVGVQIHHISPIKNRQDVVWYITVQGLIILGKLFLTGKYSPEIVVSVAGSAATQRHYVRTVIGAPLQTIIGDHVSAGDIRYISGNILTGDQVGAGGYLGFYDQTVTLIPEATEPEFIGWMLPGANRLSKYRAYLSSLLSSKRFAPDTKLNGGIRAFVATGVYEKVLPMDIYPVHLAKSILVQDIEKMEGLGIYEVAEEDIALCEYICPSKIEMQQIIRDGINLIHNEG